MLEDSQFLGTEYFEEDEEIQERIGHRNPPIGVSLFSGAGGFDLGFAQAGFDVRVMVENDETACDTLRMNEDCFNDHTEPEIIEKDIREVSTKEILEAAGVGVGGVTVVYGGPPCQGFSMAGNRDPDDDRNALYREMVRVVQEAKLLFFVMENVKGLASMEDGEVIRRVCREFRDCGYNVQWDVLDAANYGVPQHRERVFIVGRRVDILTSPPHGIGNPQFHMGAKPGKIEHPEFFREKHDIQDHQQSSLDSYTREPETLDEMIEQVIQQGGNLK